MPFHWPHLSHWRSPTGPSADLRVRHLLVSTDDGQPIRMMLDDGEPPVTILPGDSVELFHNSQEIDGFSKLRVKLTYARPGLFSPSRGN
jgi:hypothetical protein